VNFFWNVIQLVQLKQYEDQKSIYHNGMAGSFDGLVGRWRYRLSHYLNLEIGHEVGGQKTHEQMVLRH
jgi:hypothetical protein